MGLTEVKTEKIVETITESKEPGKVGTFLYER